LEQDDGTGESYMITKTIRWVRRSTDGSYWCGNGRYGSWNKDITCAHFYKKKPDSTNEQIKVHEIKIVIELGEPEDANI